MNIPAKMRYSVWLPETKIDLQIKVLLFLVSPFYGFLYALRRIKTKSSFVIFFLFALCFGMAFTPDKRGTEAYIDGQNYAEEMPWFANMSDEHFYSEFKEFLAFSEGKKDYYYDFMAFHISKFTSNYHVMFLIFAMVFAFFSLKTYKYLVIEKEFDNSYICILLSYLFMFNGIFNINGVRFWTAYWVALLALFKIFKDGNYKYLLLLLITPFFHGSYWLVISLAVIIFLTRKFYNVWIILYFLSFFFGQLSLQMANESIDYLPTFLQGPALSYISMEKILKSNQVGTGFWIVGEIFNYIVSIFFFVVMIIFIKNKRTILADERVKNIFLLLLSLMTFANFTMPIPSVGIRFIILTYPLVAYIWLVCFKGKFFKGDLFLKFIPLYFFMTLYSQLTLYLSTLNIDFFIASPIYLIIRYLVVS
ncbi:EpsG family protein [Odoribacter laneus]|uniref:EpsG family protein n=1 Tax=Odoribacter laneus TaxID=626933 RepID=UPI003AF9AA74